MKKALALFVISALFSGFAFSQPFVPQTMRLNPNHADRWMVNYDWTQSNISIPVEVQGNASKAVLMVYTNGIADQVSPTKNGFIGWHYVNKVDTCLYVSPENTLTSGDNTINWDLKDKTGNKVSKANMTYYVFAYEYNTPKTLVMKRQLNGSNMGVYRESYLDAMGTAGSHRTAPIILYHSRRWVVGGDPNDTNNYKTTSDNQTCKYALDINDDAYMYRAVTYSSTASLRVTKWQFVENGTSVQDASWASVGYVDTHSGYWGTVGGTLESAGCQRDANYLYVTGNQRSNNIVQYWMLNFSGEIIKFFDLSDIYVRQAGPRTGLYLCGGPLQQTLFNQFSGTKVLLNHHGFCWRVCIDPIRGLADENDVRVWVNGNGDFFTDHNMDDPADSLYMECNDVNKAPYCYQLTADNNGLSVICANQAGVTFGLMGPDGTGAGYHAVYGESSITKFACQFYGYGTQWDGLYTDANSTDNTGTTDASGAWYIPANSYKGLLHENTLDMPGVKEKSPAGFSVAQNSPNPFNPSTDITFTIPNKGMVTIDIYNVAGQKVRTLKNEVMEVGTHKVKWDASSLSGGVYFYTVSSGKFSKTMKMTLAK